MRWNKFVALPRRIAVRLFPQTFHKRHGRLYVARRATRSYFERLSDLRPRATTAPQLVDVAVVASGLEPDAIHEVFPAEHVELQPPRNARAQFARIPFWYSSSRWRLDHDTAPATVLELPGGIVFGQEGWLGPDQFHTIGRWNTYSRKSVEIARACTDCFKHGCIDVPGTSASLLQLGWGNYYHWMLQDLPRLFTILNAFDQSEIDQFLVGPIPPFISESLDRLQIDLARVQEVAHPAPVLRCETLIAANMPRHESPTPSWAIERLRATFSPVETEANGTRIYIERGDSLRRRVVNESEVVALLESYGFRSMTFDGMTIAEQAGVVVRAEVIVAAHGAALTNLVFASPGTRVIELVPANNPQPFFWHLAAQVGADYETIVGSEPAIGRVHNVWMNDADIIVNIRDIEQAVRRAVDV